MIQLRMLPNWPRRGRSERRRRAAMCALCGMARSQVVYADNGSDYCRHCFSRIWPALALGSAGRRSTDLDPFGHRPPYR
jgi:hypothetical protein